jgi:hypothetical protein
MATLKYWDGAAYQPLAGAASIPAGGSQGQVLQKNSAASYDTVWASGAPVQAPPPTGFNSFTDGSGEVWVSYNGSAWKKARDALHARVYRSAAYSIAASAWVTLPFDTVDSDAYALWSMASSRFTAPVAGWWLFTAYFGMNTPPPTYGYLLGALFKNGVSASYGGQQTYAGGGNLPASATTGALLLAVNDYVQPQGFSSAAIALTPGRDRLYLDFHYLGTG